MKHLKLKTLTALMFAVGAAQAQTTLPTGMTVVAGQATAAQNGKQLTITNGNGTILDWRSFSIGADAAVRFNQPSSTSAVLNRVSGTDPSSILGSLSSNGRVWLLNPNGVLFGQGARVDVASLVTSTLNISNSDWQAGRMVFAGTGAGSIVNQGEIQTGTGGRVALIGSAVRNEGTISAPDGQVVLAAGTSVELVDTGAPNLSIKLTAGGNGQALNLGKLSGGRVDVVAAAVNQQGIVEAQSIVMQADGRLTLAGGSSTKADGADKGGSIQLLGTEIELQDGAKVSANGASGGGTVLIGGGAEGKDASVPNAQGVYFAQGASVSADALVNGDGGHIVLWADQATRAYGSLSAQGGAQGGNGGLIETSGGWLDARPFSLQLQAPHGKGGTWLLDPYNITISSSGGDSGYDPATFTANANDATINTSTIVSALDGGADVTISTGTGGAQAGNITLTSASISPYNPGTRTLTLIAAGDIVTSDLAIQPLYTTLNLVMKAGQSGQGAIVLDDATIYTNGGSISLGGFGAGGAAVGHAGTPDGVLITRSLINAGAGDLNVTGLTAVAGGRGVGIDHLVGNNSIVANNININGSSTSGIGTQISDGSITAAAALNITGKGGQDGVSIVVGDPNVSPIVLDSSAGLTLTGTSTGTGYGVRVDATAGQPASNPHAVLDAGAGALTIVGSNVAGGSSAVAVLGSNDYSDQWDTTGALLLTATGGGMRVSGISMVNNNTTTTATSDAALIWQNVNLNPVGAVALQGATVSLSGVSISALLSPSVTISSAGNMTLSNTTLYATDASLPMDISLNAGTSGVGSLSISDSYFYSGGGTIALANGGTAPGGSAAGIAITGTTLQADAGTVLIDGRANGTGAGLLLDVGSGSPNSFSGDGITLNGQSSGGRGVEINAGMLSADGTLSVTGTGTDGLYVTNANQSNPVTFSGSGVSLTGTSTGSGFGVYLEAPGSSFDFIDTSNLVISGQNSQGGMNALVIQGSVGNTTFSMSGDTTLNATGAGMLLRNVSMGGELGDTKLYSNNTLVLDSSQISGNTVLVQAFSAQLLGSSVVAAYADGTSILFEGPSSNPINLFDNQAGSGALYVGSSLGRWLIWSFDTANTSAIQLGGLSYNFQRYNAGSVAASDNDFGSGVLSYNAHYATVNGTVTSRAYDGTTTATISNVTITPDVAGDQTGSVSTYTASFASKDAGTRAVAVNFSAAPEFMDATGHEIYGYQVQDGASGTITPALLSGTVTAANRVYNATTGATVNVSNLTGFVGSETVGVGATGSFADKNAGTGKTVNVSYQLSDGTNGGLASNYAFTPPANSVTADITPASIAFTATAQNKVYDGTTAATVNNVVITSLSGDQLGVSLGTASFVDKNAGTGKAVRLSGATLTGADAGNYQLVNLPTFSASITPATLTYSANPATLQSGAPLPSFTGSVSGFVSGDTQANATTGTLAFDAAVSSSTVPGLYAINGSGLSAVNYQFVQAAGNATALNVVGGGPAETQAQAAAVPINNVQPMPTATPSPVTTGLVDLTPAPVTSQATATAASFDSAPIASMAPQAVADLLGARASAMKALLGDSLNQLKSNPAASDVAPCKSLKEASTGLCLVTEALKLEARQQGVRQAAAPAPKPAAPAPGQAAAPAVAAAAAAAAAPAPAPAPLFASRKVKTAALPEIRRKLAVLIGQGQYADKSIPTLANAPTDAHAVADTLSSQLGYETVVLDNPTKEQVIATLNKLALEAGEQDSVVIYYAGHGAEVDATGQGYWLPSNADASKPQTWLSNADIGRLVSQIGAKQVALVSDSCYSGALVSGEKIRGATGQVNPTELLAKRSAVVMSSGGNEPVFDSGRGGHSLFAWSLMRNLEQVKAWQLGGNVFERVRFSVARELPQRPQYGSARGSEGGDYFFEARQLDTAAAPPQAGL